MSWRARTPAEGFATSGVQSVTVFFRSPVPQSTSAVDAVQLFERNPAPVMRRARAGPAHPLLMRGQAGVRSPVVLCRRGGTVLLLVMLPAPAARQLADAKETTSKAGVRPPVASCRRGGMLPVMLQRAPAALLMSQLAGAKPPTRSFDASQVILCRLPSVCGRTCQRPTPRDMIRVPIREPATALSFAGEGTPMMQSAMLFLPASASTSPSPDAARRKHSAQAAAQPQFHGREGLGPKSAQQAAESKPSRDVAASAAAAAGGKMPSPPRRDELQAENLAPLREKILKTVDALKGDLSELFSKSPDLNPTKRARPPHLPKQEGRTASTFPARARRAAAVGDQHGHGCAAKTAKDGRAAAAPPRGLPSRRYRRCRADPPCCDDLQPRPCGRHGFCRHHCHHGKPECSSCRGHCARPRAQEPSASRKTPPAAAEAKRRPPPPRHHCRPVLKGAPFIICSSCFNLLQVPADFAVSTSRLRKLRCGSCSAVLSYSYGDPARKKNHPQDSVDQFSSDGSDSFVHGGEGNPHPDPFAPFLDDFGLSSYSTEDEQPLHVSRNTSFDTLDGVKRVGRLHRLMGCASASELLRHSPDLYESVDERTTPDYDRKGKGVCIDAEDDDLDDSDDEDSGAHKRSAAKGAVWPLPGMPGKGAPGAGAIRIKS